MAKPTGRPNGRPKKHNKELEEKLLDAISTGESLWKITARSDMPSRSIVFRWMDEIDGFREKYAKAKEMAAEKFAEEIIDIADDESDDYIEADDGKIVINTNKVRRAELKIKARQWMASKIQPKKYGERIQQEITQPEGVTFNMNYGDKKKEN